MDAGACSSPSPTTQVVEEKLGALSVGESLKEKRENVSPSKRRMNISNRYKPGVDFKEAPLSEKDGEGIFFVFCFCFFWVGVFFLFCCFLWLVLFFFFLQLFYS